MPFISGGTIDITAHEIQRDGSVKELLAASGGAWGGTKVDEGFINLLMKILGREFILKYQHDCPSDWLDLRVNFERRKKAVKPNDRDAIISIQLSWNISGKFQEVTGKSIEKVIRSTSVQGVKFNNGNMVFDASVVEGLFKPVTSHIVSHIQQQLRSQNASGIKTILLVGGFGECAFVQDAISRGVGRSIKVLCPSEAGISIIKGATLFGHQPAVVSSRVARKTYGTIVRTRFIPNTHPEHRKKICEDGPRCEVFQTFVEKGENVCVTDVKTFRYSPHSSTATAIYQTFCSADIKDVTYPDDPTVKTIGKMTIEMPDITGGLNRKIETKVYFGATEIYVESQEVKARGYGNKANTTLDFLAD